MKTMPKTTDNYQNVACASAEWVTEDCKQVPIETKWWLKVEKKIIEPADGIITKTWEQVVWEIKVTAEWWDVKMEYIKDTLPVELQYEDYTREHIPEGITVEKPVENWREIRWETTWTLKSWDYIKLHLLTRVIKMPEPRNKKVVNIACAKPNPWEEKCATWETTELCIKKYILDGNNEVKSITLNPWDTIIYKIKFGNKGNVPVYVTIKDFLPKGVTFLSGRLNVTYNSQGQQHWWWEVSYSWKNTIIEWIDIALYSWVFLRGGYEWELIIYAQIPETVTDEGLNTTNFACIYNESGNRVDCDDAVYHIGNTSCKPTLSPAIFAAVCPSDTSKFSTTATCKSSDWRKADIEILCDGVSIKSWHASQLEWVCSSNENNIKHKVQCKINGSFTWTNWEVCEGSFIRNTKSCGWPSGWWWCQWDNCNPTKYCTIHEGDPICDLANPRCFNINAWNFSIESGEYLPFYFNVYRDIQDTSHKYVFAKDDEKCDLWQVDLGSLRCTYIIKRPDGEIAYSSGNIKCLELTDERDNSDTLIGKWVKQQYNDYSIDVRDDLWWKYWPHIEYTRSDTWNTNNILWEYQFQIEVNKYRQCNDNWERVNINKEDASVCQSNFVLTEPYTVQKTPSGNLTASTNTLNKFKDVDWNKLYEFSRYLNAIATSEYRPNQNVDDAMTAFIDKYEKLAVSVKMGNQEMKKVPWKNIYFISWSYTIEGWKYTKPFTFVQTNPNSTITIKWNSSLNMMILTKWNIAFEWDCTTNQNVKWIFYASKNLIRNWVKKNDTLNNNVWCTQGWLNIKWVLIWNDFNSLMKQSRSHLENWFEADEPNDKKIEIMNWASVVIEYSPSIFTKSTMPPGAEDFTTALSIYKQ